MLSDMESSVYGSEERGSNPLSGMTILYSVYLFKLLVLCGSRVGESNEFHQLLASRIP
jgi:hypothetical protein